MHYIKISLFILVYGWMFTIIYADYKKLNPQEKKHYLKEKLIALIIATLLWAPVLYYFFNATEPGDLAVGSLAFALLTVFGLRSWHTNCRWHRNCRC